VVSYYRERPTSGLTPTARTQRIEALDKAIADNISRGNLYGSREVRELNHERRLLHEEELAEARAARFQGLSAKEIVDLVERRDMLR
jgi:hypothetical protein